MQRVYTASMGSLKTSNVTILIIICIAALVPINFALLNYHYSIHDKKMMEFPVTAKMVQSLDYIVKYSDSIFIHASASSDDSGRLENNSNQANPMLPINSVITGNWSIYTDAAYNFRLSYPLNWKKVVNEDNVTLFLPSASNKSLTESINLQVLSSGNVPLSESASLEIIRLKQTKDEFKLKDFQYTTVSKNPAYILVYTYGQGDDTYKVLHMATSVGGKSYSFNFLSNLKTFKNYLPVASRVINSLELEELPIQGKNISTDLPQLSVARDPFDIVIDPITDNVYIVNFRSHSISVLDGMTNKLLTEIKVGRFPLAASVNPDLGTVYVANSRSNTISVIDSSTNEVVKDIPVGNRPVAVVVDGTEKGIDSMVFSANLESNSVSAIDASKNQLYVPDLLVGKEPSDIAVNDVTNRIYVANRGSNDVSVIDYYITNQGKFKNATIATIKVQEYPSGIGINPITNKIYVANYYSNTISVIDGASNNVTNTIKVGTNPSSIAINPSNNRLYVTNYGSNTVSVIDGYSEELLKNIEVGSFPIKAYFNPRTEIVSVINIGTQTLSEIRGTSLIAGASFNINPSNSGYLDCNGKRITNFDYERYNVGEQIECKAISSSNYVFGSWSTNLPVEATTSSDISFKSSGYSNTTANFQLPVEINLPWDKFLTLIGTIVVSTIVGWSFPAVMGYVNGRRQRKVLRHFMETIGQYISTGDDSQRRRELQKTRNDIIGKLTEGKISESQYNILNNKISELLDHDNKSSS